MWTLQAKRAQFSLLKANGKTHEPRESQNQEIPDQSKTLAREQEAEKQSKVDLLFVRKREILMRVGQITKSGGKDPRTEPQKSPKNSYYNLFLTSCSQLWARLYI